MEGMSSESNTDMANCDALLNLTILDPPKYGWSVLGGIRNVCPPHENARRESTRLEYLAEKTRQHQQQPTAAIASSQVINKDELHSMKSSIENGDVVNKEKEDTHRNAQGNDDPSNKNDNVTQPTTTISTSTNHSKYDFGPQYSVDVQVVNRSKSKRKPSKTVSIQVVPFIQLSTTHNDHTTTTSISTTTQVSEPCTTSTQPKESTETKESHTVSSNVNTQDNHKSLHPRAYHRGIEGEEPRNKSTGQLYKDVGMTDTNYAWDILPRDCIIPIRIQFPLTEPDSDHDMSEEQNSISVVKQRRNERRCKSPMLLTESQRRAQRESKDANLVIFDDTIQWDLSNPNTPTPIVYATNLGAEFGLSFLRILDLARSIQSQIDEFVRDYVIYHVPISALDSYDQQRSKSGLQPVKYKYETKMHGGHCATNVATQFKLFDDVQRCTHALEDLNQESNSVVESQKSNRKKKDDKVIKPNKYSYDVTPIDQIPTHDIGSYDVDPMYSKEFFRRAKEENIKMIKNLAVKATECSDGKCHFCRRSRKCSIQFPCGIESHVYCDFHTSKRFGWRVEDALAKKLNYCPICSLECTCSRCSAKARSTVSLFFEECQKQSVGPNDVSFNFTWHCSQTLSKQAKNMGIIGTKASQTTKTAPNIIKKTSVHRTLPRTEDVPKIARDEFPNELAGTINLDPSLKDDYNTIFTPQGSTVVERQHATANAPSPRVLLGDENIEYCIKCKRIGHMVCCERCPRSFHAECLPGINVDDLPDEWVCPCCAEDSSKQDEDVKTGSTVFKKLTQVYEMYKDEIEFLDKITILGQLYEISEGLINTDFGPIFSEPVDAKVVTTYKKFVKRPMDLGTIMSNILQGVYAKYDSVDLKGIDGFEEALQMDLIILHVLKDMEQIWHNCFIFNRPGSSFYRMGAVMQTRCSVMKMTNIDSKLTDFVKQNYQSFVQKCEADLQNSVSQGAEKDWIPSSKYQIHNAHAGRGIIGNMKKKPVGIYDPDTKMVIKQYSSINIALSVYDFLVSIDHKSGLKSSNKALLRQYINASPSDPSIKVFGYRWMAMENIRSGSFKIDVDGQDAKTDDQMNVSNAVLNDISQTSCSGTNISNNDDLEETAEIIPHVTNVDKGGCSVRNVENEGGDTVKSGIGSMNILSSSEMNQQEKECNSENKEDGPMPSSFSGQSSNSYSNSESGEVSKINHSSMPVNASASEMTACTPRKKRSLEEMNGIQNHECSSIKLNRAKIGSLCENVRYSPRVQRNALSAAQEISCNHLFTACDDKIVAIDISSLAVENEYDNLASAARNMSQDELLKSIHGRIPKEGKLFILASEKDTIINAMRLAVQPIDLFTKDNNMK